MREAEDWAASGGKKGIIVRILQRRKLSPRRENGLSGII